jgi:hypothetical protein
LAAFSDGSVIVTGTFANQITFGPGEFGEVTLTVAGGPSAQNWGDGDIFVAKYDPTGAIAWAKRAGSVVEAESGTAVAALPDSSAVITGRFLFEATFGQGESGEVTLRPADPYQDAFVAKYSAVGALIWAKSAGGIGYDTASAIAVSPNGDMLVTGFRPESLPGSERDPEHTLPDSGEPFLVARYDSQGSQLWAKSAVLSGTQEGTGVASLGDGTALVTGTFRGDATFGTGENGEVTLAAAGGEDIFIARYDVDGTLAWAMRVGGSGPDWGSGIAVLTDGNAVVLGGVTQRTPADRAAAENTFGVTLEPGFFIAKFAP